MVHVQAVHCSVFPDVSSVNSSRELPCANRNLIAVRFTCGSTGEPYCSNVVRYTSPSSFTNAARAPGQTTMPWSRHNDVMSERVKRELCSDSVSVMDAHEASRMDPARDEESEDRDVSRRDFSDVALGSGGSAVRTKGRAQPALVCQVPGCEASLICLREYYQRYKICEYHRQLDQMVGCNGELQRFCQQCGRFHSLTAFDDNKRSCRERLAKHNERRRRRTAGDLSTYGCPNGSGAEAQDNERSSNVYISAGAGAPWGQGAFAPELTLPTNFQQQQQHVLPRDSFHLQLQMMQLQELDQKMLLTSAAQPAATLFTPSLNPMDSFMLQPRPLYPVDIPLPQPIWDKPSDSGTRFSNAALSERGSHSMSKLPHIQSPEPELHQSVSHLSGHTGDVVLQPGFLAGAYTNRPAFVRGVAPAEERRGRRKHCSWPLAQLRMQGQEATAQEMGLITGVSGEPPGDEGSYHSFSDEATRTAGLGHGSATHLSQMSMAQMSMGMSQRLSQPSDIRVLGENQTLAALWENIMVDDA